jgi:branched-chain amino acid transport system substrate-binding protein
MIGERLDALFGLGPALVYALAPALERDHVPLVNFGFVSAPVVGRPLIVRTMNHTAQYMQALATYMKRDGTRDFAVVDGEHFFLKAMTDSLRKGLGSDSKLSQIASVTPDETDFRSVIPKLRNYQSAKVGIILFSNSLVAFLQQARRMRFSSPFFGTDTCEGAATLVKDPALLDGCIYPDNNASQSFQDSYHKKFGDKAHITFAANAYDMAVLVGEVFTRMGKLKAAEFVQALGKVQSREGVLGAFSYKETPEHGKFFEYPVYVKRMTQGQGVVVE